MKFIVYTFLVAPLFVQAVVGYSRKKDIAWFFHPIACLITLWEYGFGFIQSLFIIEEQNRDGWKQ